MMKLSAAIAFGLVLAPCAVSAQIWVSAPPPTAAECGVAADTLRTGSLTNERAQLDALSIVGACGVVGGAAVATAMERYRFSALTRTMRFTFSGHRPADTAVLRAATSIALDNAASPAARVSAIGVLMVYADSSKGHYEDLAATVAGEGCLGGHPVSFVPGTLPPNTADQIKPLVAALERDTLQPAQIRSAANCVMNTWRRSHGVPVQVIAAWTPSSFAVQWVCGNRFRFTNAASHWMAVQFTVGGPARRIFRLAPGSNNEVDVGPIGGDPGAIGPVTLFFDDDVIQIAQNGGTACP